MQDNTWTIKRCFEWTRDYLANKGDKKARLSTEWLLSSVTGLTRTELYMSFDRPLSKPELDAMHNAIVRRANGEPLQYIAGETSFRTITVKCEPGVLIPRPETELLVEEVLTFLDREVLGEGAAKEHARRELPWNAEVEAARVAEQAAAREEVLKPEQNKDENPELETIHQTAKEASYTEEPTLDAESNPAAEPITSNESVVNRRVARVLEVGCGTGCISLSLATERAGHVTCVAIDIEPKAVALATQNRDALGITSEVLDIRLGNLVSPLNKETEWGTFDVLVSNPPYIPTKAMNDLPDEVSKFEPALALDGGEDGLDIFRRLVAAAPYMLRPGGLLACELYEGHLDAAVQLCKEAGLVDVRIVEDLTHRPRMILACTAQAANTARSMANE